MAVARLGVKGHRTPGGKGQRRHSPLTFTAVNPRGSRLTTFTLKPDNAIAISGPYLNNPAATFYDEGGCVRSA